MDSDRARVVQSLKDALEQGVLEARAVFEGLQGSLEGESKSTAGDKHETGRAMVQLEMEQAAGRMHRMESMVRQWVALDPSCGRSDVRPGAVVRTDMGGFVIGVALGVFKGPDGEEWRAISSDAPLAQAMLGSRAGGTVEFRGRQWSIEAVG